MARKLVHSSQRGAVSLFVVVFTALLVTIVATSFIQIMLKNQQQASTNDLSQSAYDSALAGVEDAKRALVRMKECDRNGLACGDTIRNELNTQDCKSLGDVGVVNFDPTTNEVTVGDESLNQAYTCVTVKLDTQYVKGTLVQDGSSTVVRLASADAFSAVRISWFTQDDIGGVTPTFVDPALIGKLPEKTVWGADTPPILRTQLLEFSPGVDLGTLAQQARTLFVYPYSTGGGPSSALDFTTDERHTADTSRNDLHIIECNTANEYFCSTTVNLPNDAAQKYLQLTSIYNKAHYRVELLDSSGNNVLFDSVQPEVDSTGRASDLFRRVRALVSLDNLPANYPDSALSVRGNVCKDFFITNRREHYQGQCEP